MKKLLWLLLIISTAAFARTVWVKQSGIFEQERSSRGAVRYKQIMTVDELARLQSQCASPVIPAPPAPTPPPPTPVPVAPPAPINYMPAVNVALNPSGHAGVSAPLLVPAQHDGVHKDQLGAFRTECRISHFGFDDPIVWPGIKNATHHHTFFGNVGTNYASTPESIRTTGNSSCDGGTLNRSGYWIPSLIDTKTGAALKPWRGIIYYKQGLVPVQFIQPFPRHLRMIAGDMLLKTPDTNTKQPPHSNGREPVGFACVNESANPSYTGQGKLIPACKKARVGRATNGYIRLHVNFPQCWDGKNLDSPDHKSHMAYAHWQQVDAKGAFYYPANRCPTTHPIPLPEITEIFDFEVTDAVHGTDNWRLSSDNYPTTTRGGLSLHADWMNGWDEGIMNRIVKNCLNKAIDCGVNYLGDGQALRSLDKK